MKLNLEWIQNLYVTTNTDKLKLPGTKKDLTNKEGVVKDDFQREMHL